MAYLIRTFHCTKFGKVYVTYVTLYYIIIYYVLQPAQVLQKMTLKKLFRKNQKGRPGRSVCPLAYLGLK